MSTFFSRASRRDNVFLISEVTANLGCVHLQVLIKIQGASWCQALFINNRDSPAKTEASRKLMPIDDVQVEATMISQLIVNSAFSPDGVFGRHRFPCGPLFACHLTWSLPGLFLCAHDHGF